VPFEVTSHLSADCHLHPMAARVEEVDRLAKAVISRTDDIDPSFDQVPLPFMQGQLRPQPPGQGAAPSQVYWGRVLALERSRV
jgi:hypothetical protein